MILAINKKPQAINFKDFMDGSYKEKERIRIKERNEKIETYAMLGISAVLLIADPMGGTITFASGLQDRIISAFDPLIQLLQGLAYPISFLMLTAGGLLIMTGQKSRGLDMIKYAGVGYILLQLAPALMAILVDIGKEMMAK
jgi:hypothetical protein